MTLAFSRRTLLALGALACTLPRAAQATAATAVIRIGSPELGTGATSFPGANPLAVVKARGWLEEEFAADGIRVEWHFFRGAGPAVNEALASGQLDLVFLGDLASVIGRAHGLPTRLIATSGRGTHSYLAVAPGSGITTFADLRGRKVSVLKGTAYQRPFDALLADAGLTEKDVRLVNLDWPTSKAAVVNRDVDATFGGADLFLLRDQGVTVPVSTKGRGPGYTIFGAVLATQAFVSTQAALTARAVRQIVRASHWASEEANRPELLDLWSAQSGQPRAVFEEELRGESLKARHSPQVDAAAISAYTGVVADALRLGLIKQPVDVGTWVAPQFVQAALAQRGWEHYWSRLDRPVGTLA